MLISLIDQSLNPAGDTELFTDGQWLQALLRFDVVERLGERSIPVAAVD